MRNQRPPWDPTTEAGVVIKPAQILVSGALDKIGRALEAMGIDLEELIERDRELKTRLLKSSPFEVKMLVEFIRCGISVIISLI